jgi:hypothetical protein
MVKNINTQHAMADHFENVLGMVDIDSGAHTH